MKNDRKPQGQLQTLATEALMHYEGIMNDMKTQFLCLLKRYSFVTFGKGLGLKFPKAIKSTQPETATKGGDLLYSQQFKRVVVYLIAREPETSQRRALKRLSRTLHISKFQLLSWLHDPALAV